MNINVISFLVITPKILFCFPNVKSGYIVVLIASYGHRIEAEIRTQLITIRLTIITTNVGLPLIMSIVLLDGVCISRK